MLGWLKRKFKSGAVVEAEKDVSETLDALEEIYRNLDEAEHKLHGLVSGYGLLHAEYKRANRSSVEYIAALLMANGGEAFLTDDTLEAVRKTKDINVDLFRGEGGFILKLNLSDEEKEPEFLEG